MSGAVTWPPDFRSSQFGEIVAGHVVDAVNVIKASDRSAAHVDAKHTRELVQGISDALNAGEESALNLFPFEPVVAPTEPLPEPSIVSDVEDGLTREGCAVVIGSSGSGKTTLAELQSSRFERTYVVDLADLPDATGVSDLEQPLRRVTSPRTLLVIDNAHAALGLARGALAAWRAQEDRGALLILSRPDIAGGSPLARVAPAPFVLEPDAAAFASVANRVVENRSGRRLASSFAGARASAWRESFAQNLVLFEAALRGALQQALPDQRGHLEVGAEQALFFARDHMDALADHERDPTLELALLGELEITAPLYLFDERQLRASIAEGIVFERDRDWRFVHPGYARLLLKAEPSSETKQAILARLIERAPELAREVAGRYLLDGNPELAKQVCALGFSGETQIDRQVSFGLQNLESSIDLARRLRAVSIPVLRSRFQTLGLDSVSAACASAVPRIVLRVAAKVEQGGSYFDIPILRRALFESGGTVSPISDAVRRAVERGELGLLANYVSRKNEPEISLQVLHGLSWIDSAGLARGIREAGPNQTLQLTQAIRRLASRIGREKTVPANAVVSSMANRDVADVLREWASSDAAVGAKLLQKLPLDVARLLLKSLNERELGDIASRLSGSRERKHLDRLVESVAELAPERLATIARAAGPDWNRNVPKQFNRRRTPTPFSWAPKAIETPTEEWLASDLGTISGALVHSDAVAVQDKLFLLESVIGSHQFDRKLRATSPRRRTHYLLHIWASEPTEVLAWIGEREILSALPSSDEAADSTTLGLLGIAALFGGAIPPYQVEEDTLDEEIRRATPGGFRGMASALLVVSGLMTTTDDELLDRNSALWVDASRHGVNVFRRADRHRGLCELLEQWHSTGVPPREERLSEITAVGEIRVSQTG